MKATIFSFFPSLSVFCRFETVENSEFALKTPTRAQSWNFNDCLEAMMKNALIDWKNQENL